MSCYITYKGKNYIQEDFLDFLKTQIPTTQFTWARRAENSYEVSSKGDTRFSALYAKLKDGRTIEEAYQLDVKGYRAQGNNWRLGKGKAPLTSMTKEQTWQAYKNLWRQFLEENPTLEQDLRNKASGKVLTDMFASTDISQARALAELLNERKSSSSTSNNPADFINHSGGAIGSDTAWDEIGREFGMVNNKHYWTLEKTPNGNTEISRLDYEEGRFESAKAAKRNFGYQYAAMKDSRLIRNWSQVKHSDAVFAIGTIAQVGEKVFPKQSNDTRLATNPTVTGGTGYAVGMAINHNKPVYVFDQNKNQWYTWNKEQNNFIETDTPTLTKNFAGIGTRQINENGKQAIRDVYEKTFSNQPQFVEQSNLIEPGDHFNFENSRTLLQSVVDHPNVESYVKDLAQQLLDKVDIDSVNLNTHIPNANTLGTFRLLENQVDINLAVFIKRKRNTVERIAETIVHEYIHAATVQGLKDFKKGLNDNIHLKNINELFIDYRNSVKDNPEFQEFLNLLERNRNGEEFVGKELERIKKLQDKYYAAYKVEEFVTMGLSNPTTREILKNRNLLQQLFDSIKEFLGLDNNVYKLLKKEYNAYLDSQANTKTEIKPYKYYGANYEIEVVNGVGVDVIGYKGSITNKNKLLQEFNKNPNIDPQTGRSFQAGTEKKKESPVMESKYELFPGVYANEGQRAAIDAIEEFFTGDKDQFLLKGRGGTGKTTIVKKTLEQFNKSSVKILGSTISYEAKNVLQDNMQGYKTATLASVLGLIPDYAKDGSMFFREKTLEERMNNSGVITPLPIETVDILIVDEASMIDEFIYNKLLELKKSRTKILFMGDNVQIPPINSRTDEEGNVIKGENSDSPVWQLIDSGDYVELSERMRQGAESPILPITDLYAKNVEEIQSGEIGIKNPLTDRTSNFQNNEGVLFTSDVNEVVNQFVEDIEGSTDIREAVIVGARNTVVDDMNLRVRKKLFETEEPFVIGDSIRINSPHVENNEVIFENGLRAKVKDVYELPEDNLGLKRYELEIEYIETNEKGDKFIRKAFLKTISPQDQKQYKNKLREMAARAKSFVPKTPESKKAWKEFFDIKNSTVDVGYGYAITSHKVQGSTYNSAYVLEGDIMSFPGGIEQTNRMMYTAVSRPRKKLVIFNPSVVESQQVSQPKVKVDIRAKVYELFNLQGYMDIKTNHKTDKNLITAISHYVLEDLGYKTDQEKLQAVREGFKLSEYITTEQISDVHTRVRLNMKNIIEDEVDDGPVSLGGIKFTSSGYESNAKNAFTCK